MSHWSETLALVIGLLSKSTGVDVSKINKDTSLESLIFDSLDLVQLLMVFEDEFQIALNDAPVAARPSTVGELAEWIDRMRSTED